MVSVVLHGLQGSWVPPVLLISHVDFFHIKMNNVKRNGLNCFIGHLDRKLMWLSVRLTWGVHGGSESTCISSRKEEVKAVLGLLLIFQVQAAFIGFLGYMQRERDDGLVSAEMTWSALGMWNHRSMASIWLFLGESGTRLERLERWLDVSGRRRSLPQVVENYRQRFELSSRVASNGNPGVESSLFLICSIIT